MASESPLKLAVLGNPVTHSLSPRIHGLFANQCGVNIEYLAIEATPETFPVRVAELAGAGGRGCNITAPFKHDAWKLAGRSSESAARAQAANTLVFNDAGSDDPSGWFADSTDGEGLVNDLKTLSGCKLTGSRICLMGAGGAAASVLGALLNTQPEMIYIANRTPERAQALAQSHSQMGSIEFGTPGNLDCAAPFDLLINATSLGHGGRPIRLSRHWFTEQGICYDMNYAAASKPLRALCLESGIPYFDGLGMLVGQAALSFRLWTGQTPDISAVLKTLRLAAA